MLDVRFRPLAKWPTELERRVSAFKTPFNRSLDKLEHELKQLRATVIVIEAGFKREDLRNDGWPRTGTAPTHAGVVLYFSGTDGPLRFPCGTYRGWQSNLHAIALTLENLRAIDRYGVTLSHQQYIGFAALPPANVISADQAAWDLQHLVGALIDNTLTAAQRKELILQDAGSYQDFYRVAARACHPNVPGNLREEWERLQRYRATLDLHHGRVRAPGVRED